MRTIKWILLMKSVFHWTHTIYLCAWQIDCITYDLCNCFPHLQWEVWGTFLWFVYLQGFLTHREADRSNHLVHSDWTLSECCLMHEVLLYRSWPHGFWSLRVDHHVSFRLDSPPQWKAESCSSSSSIDSYIFAWFSPRWKEIMSFVRAMSGHQSYKER